MKRWVTKTLELNLLRLTKTKRSLLESTLKEYASCANHILDALRESKPSSSTELHHLTYEDCRRRFSLQAQLVEDCRRDVWANRGRVNRIFTFLPLSYNVPRSGGLRETKRGNPVFSVSTINGRIGVPVKQDGTWKRLQEHLNQGYGFTHFKLLPHRGWVAQVTLRKQFEMKAPHGGMNVLGVDVGVKRLAAVSVVSPEGRILRQIYFGQDVGDRQRDICLKRSRLRSHADNGSRYARRKLRRLREDESNYTKTRGYQVAHQIVELAKKNDATIAIENLKGLRDARGNRKGNRKSKRLPYYKFQQALQSVAHQNGVETTKVKARNTSKTCSRCDEIGHRNGGYFRCPSCGYEANADRNASVNIAKRLLRSLPGRELQADTPTTCTSQTPGRGAPVNVLVRRHGLGAECQRHIDHPMSESPRPSGRG